MRVYGGIFLAAIGSILIAVSTTSILGTSSEENRRLPEEGLLDSAITVPNSLTQQAVSDAKPVDCASGLALYRSVFTDELSDGVPQSRLMVLGSNMNSVVFSTEVIGAGGQEITHRWFHDDREVNAFSFELKTERSPTWSSHSMNGLAPGRVRVEISVGDCLIGQKNIEIAAVAQIDPALVTGWMRPQQALETILARQAIPFGDGAKNPSRTRIVLRDESGDTPVTAAIRREDSSEILKLIKYHDMRELPGADSLTLEEHRKYTTMANPFSRDAKGISPLDLAQRTGQTEIVEALLEVILDPAKGRRPKKHGRVRKSWSDSTVRSAHQGMGVGQRFANGDTGLLRAVRLGNELAVFTMLELGAKKSPSQRQKITRQLFAFDASGHQALEIAISEGFYGVERFLRMALEEHEPEWSLYRATFAASMAGEEPQECRKVGFEDESEMYFFAELTDLQSKAVHHEWRFKDELVHSEKFESESPIWKTRSKRRFTSADVGAWDVRVVTEKGVLLGSRRLHYKAMTPRIEKNRQSYIGSEGCDLGGSAMGALARAQAPISKIQYLIDQGASMKPRSNRHQNLFFQAIESGNIALTRWFLDRGVDIDAWVKDGKMPLAVAVEAGEVPMVLFLLAKGADINKQRHRGKQTALVTATIDLDIDLARLLLEHGADPNLLGERDFAALHTATNRCSGDVSALLLKYGADPLAVTRQGETPQTYAAKCPKGESWQPEMPGLAPLLIQESSVRGALGSDEG